MRMREQGASDTRPYTLLDIWSSVIPGVKSTDMRLEFGYPNSGHPLYGEDNLPDPWSNSTIKLIQNAFNPVAAIDSDFWNANKMSNPAGEWPTTRATITSGPTTRNLTLFNDTRAGTTIKVDWRLHQGSATGPVKDSGLITAQIPLGEHRSEPLTFNAPPTDQPLYLELAVSKPGQGVLYHDASTVYTQQ